MKTELRPSRRADIEEALAQYYRAEPSRDFAQQLESRLMDSAREDQLARRAVSGTAGAAARTGSAPLARRSPRFVSQLLSAAVWAVPVLLIVGAILMARESLPGRRVAQATQPVASPVADALGVATPTFVPEEAPAATAGPAGTPSPATDLAVAPAATAVVEQLAPTVQAAASSVESFSLTELSRSWYTENGAADAGEEYRTETSRWYQAPDRWRVESSQRVLGPDGSETDAYSSVQVADGIDIWYYDTQFNMVKVSRLPEVVSGAAAPGDVVVVAESGRQMASQGMSMVMPFGEPIASLDDVLEQAGSCFEPQVTAEEVIAGRPAYVVDLGPTLCPSASSLEGRGRQVMWIDKDTYFLLKMEIYNNDGTGLLMTREVTSITYGTQLDPALFRFDVPEGALVSDARPKPAPTESEYRRQLADLAAAVDFPLFAPVPWPSGLAPRQPEQAPVGLGLPSVTLQYVPPDEVEDDTYAGQSGILISEQRGDYATVAMWIEGAEPVSVASARAWLRRGIREIQGGATDAAAILLRDGTLVSVSSFALSADELLSVAEAMQPVPGGHPPLPEPVPPTLAEARAQAGHPIYLPTWVPEGLVPEPPLGTEIIYHRADGSIGLRVYSALAGSGIQPGQGGDEPALLASGVEAHLLVMPDSKGGTILFWEQDDTYIALSGPGLGRDDLIRIANSVSATAEYEASDWPPARPTATPSPLPAKVLRPTWLPDEMTVTERADGDMVFMGFDSHPQDSPHDVMTLIQMPVEMAGGGEVVDPQASLETVGDHDVTVIRRGDACTSFVWEQDGLQLTLTNAYDPPGEIRYTCDEMRQVIASIR